MPKQLDIYFSDLTEEAKKQVLELYGVKRSEELNLNVDIIPLFTLMNESEDSEDRENE